MSKFAVTISSMHLHLFGGNYSSGFNPGDVIGAEVLYKDASKQLTAWADTLVKDGKLEAAARMLAQFQLYINQNYAGMSVMNPHFTPERERFESTLSSQQKQEFQRHYTAHLNAG
ncbi:MAG: hypothetical protein GC131_05600 [Alphaproteobacteria bacterium]|nr:hypothetical protein [Alphaproteobacteria bacterium]